MKIASNAPEVVSLSIETLWLSEKIFEVVGLNLQGMPGKYLSEVISACSIALMSVRLIDRKITHCRHLPLSFRNRMPQLLPT